MFSRETHSDRRLIGFQTFHPFKLGGFSDVRLFGPLLHQRLHLVRSEVRLDEFLIDFCDACVGCIETFLCCIRLFLQRRSCFTCLGGALAISCFIDLLRWLWLHLHRFRRRRLRSIPVG